MNQESIKDALISADAGIIHDNTVDGKCIGCGECCSNRLPVLNSEVTNIKRYMKIHNIKEQSHFAPYANVPVADLTCPFLMLGKKKKCAIYEVRPKACRDFICNQKKEMTPEEFISFATNGQVIDMRKTFFK